MQATAYVNLSHVLLGNLEGFPGFYSIFQASSLQSVIRLNICTGFLIRRKLTARNQMLLRILCLQNFYLDTCYTCTRLQYKVRAIRPMNIFAQSVILLHMVRTPEAIINGEKSRRLFKPCISGTCALYKISIELGV